MTLSLWARVSYCLFIIPLILGGLPFIPRSIGTPRNFLFAGLALFLGSLLKKDFRENFKKVLTNQREDLNQEQYLLWFRIILMTAFIFYLKVLVLNTYSFQLVDVDFSYFDQMIGNYIRGKGWWSDSCECNHMGVHSTYYFYLFAPFHYLFDSPLFLQTIHGVSLASALIPLKGILEHFKIRKDLSLLLIFSYISYSPAIIILNYNFHFEVFYIPLFLAMMLFYFKEKWRWVHLFAFLSLLVKEDAGFYLLGFVLAVCYEKRNFKQATLLLAYTVVVTLVSLKVFIPSFRGTENYVIAGTASIYGSSIKEVVFNMAKDPFGVLKLVFTGRWWKFLLPFAGIPLLQLGFLLSVSSFVLIHSTASSSVMRNLMLYYVAPLLPFLIAYYLQGVSKLQKKNYIILYSALFIAFVGGGRVRMEPLNSFHLEALDYIHSLDLKEKSICAQGSVMPHLGHESKFTTLRKCDFDNNRYDLVFIATNMKLYPFSREEINEKNELVASKYKLLKKIDGFYVYEK